MSIKAGQILHDIHGFVIDRIQTAGPGQVNINEERVYELGNYETVATTRDIPDLSFDLESFDTSCEIEALLTLEDPSALSAGQAFDFRDHCPVDVISPFKAGGTSYSITKGIAVPYLTLESASYRFGLRENATQSFSLRGDGIFYIPGSPRHQIFTVTAGTNQAYNFANTALLYEEGGDSLYALSVTAKNTAAKTYKRLFITDDYTNTASALTVLEDLDALGYDELHVVYGTATVDTYNQTVHASTAVKPAAVRGKDIDMYLSDGAATPTLTRWTGVQSFEVNWSVSLEADEEFGNYKYVAQDYDVPEVTGSVTVKSVDADDLWEKIHQITGVSSTDVVGALSQTSLPLELRINHPDTGDRIKTLYVEDAQFSVPSIQGQVETKLEVTFNFTSAGGNLIVYNGERP